MAPWRQGDALQAALDIGADIRYQEQAEGQLQQSQAVLYTNTCAFTSFTADGTRWATEANALAARHKSETPCNRTGLIALGGQVAMRAWGCETKPSPRGIPCPAAC